MFRVPDFIPISFSVFLFLFYVMLCYLFCYYKFFQKIITIIIIFFIFRDVPECSVFLVLSTACAISSEYKSVSTYTHTPVRYEISAGSVFLGY